MHGLEWRGAAVTRGRFHEPGRFGRMFPHLRSLTEFKPGAKELGKPTGVMNGGTSATPTNDAIKSGFTFFGQFLDHDITFDPTSSLERQNDPAAIRNFRTPAFELDSVYGAGPGAQPYLYDPDFPGCFVLGRGSPSKGQNDEDLPAPADLPRMARPAGAPFGHTAIIGDPRNDENQIISQIHLGFLKVHNRLHRELAGRKENGARVFEETQRQVRWHYQWLIRNEFLRLTCGQDVIDAIQREGRRFFTFKDEAYMPVEFSVAAYRFGHSQVRPGYGLNRHGGASIFPDPIDPNQPDEVVDPEGDLRGNRPLLARKRLDWTRFFGDGASASMRIDTKLNTRLLILPPTVVPPIPKTDGVTGQPVANAQGSDGDQAVRSLAERNLQRGITFNLPSGQDVARYMGIAPLAEEDLWKDVPGGSGPAPLWFYILREAELGGGDRLYGVGARIVAEVFIGLLEGDLASYVNREPNWTPTLPKAGETFTMLDFLQYGAEVGED